VSSHGSAGGRDHSGGGGAGRQAGGAAGPRGASAGAPRGLDALPGLAALEGHRRGYYWRACHYCALLERERPVVSRNRHAEQFRIKAVGAAWGTRLDDLRASLEMIRWVADAHAPRFHAHREARYRAVVALLEGGALEGEDEEDRERPLWRRFAVLRAQMPKVGRAAVRDGG